jgi:hypothetical protein
MNNPLLREAVSRSLLQANLEAERRWNGLCVECCLALSWPLSLENLGAVKVSLLSIYAQPSHAVLRGASGEQFAAAWSTFAQKVLADLRRDSKRMLMQTRWSWLNFLQSSLTRLIYSNRRMRQLSRRQWSNGSSGQGAA